MKKKSLTEKRSKAKKPVAGRRTVSAARAKPASLKTAGAQEAINQGLLAELVVIAGDMRELLSEIRNLLAEGAVEGAEAEAEEEPQEGFGTVIIAETEGGEDLG